jgi:Icc-related predicted phosphoesterase
MARLAWLTDIHLNFISPARRQQFYQSVWAVRPDAVLIGGDIGEADSVQDYLWELEDSLAMPIYFVLGNHDFYGGSLLSTRARILDQTARSRYLRWLPPAGVVALSKTTALIGHDGWGDGRLGDGPLSQVLLSDFFVIEELRDLDKLELFHRLNLLGDEAAEYVRRVLPQALDSFARVILLTHVPPFQESCWHEGRISNPDFLPHYTCQALGEALVDLMDGRPDRHLTVLCGHTHSSGFAQIRPNLAVRTGVAEYGAPVIQEVFEV